MISSGDELETFKTDINLTEYAAASGYRLDRKASSRNSVVMVHPERDKIIIAVDRDRHWIYFAIGEDTDNGSIIDFVQKRKGGNLGDVRSALRPWLFELAPSKTYRRRRLYFNNSTTRGLTSNTVAKRHE